MHVRNTVFIADYWNNVIRCVNLLTTQVDTVLDFSPLGPVGFSISPQNGVMYVLDAEFVHYINVLRITSAPNCKGRNE